jgi:signal transduction histidine kinase
MKTLFLVRESAVLPRSAQHYLDIADAELRRIAHITRQSLGFYRESTAPTTVCVSDLLDSVTDLLRSKIKAKHVQVERQCSKELDVTGVMGELRQVFSNLLANSLDAVDENGQIRLRASVTPSSVRITISDNGKGIPPAALFHIFEPFFTTKGPVGTGLGLWVTKQIIDKHRGFIQVRSRTEGPRRGTTFSVTLPADSAAPTLDEQAA